MSKAEEIAEQAIEKIEQEDAGAAGDDKKVIDTEKKDDKDTKADKGEAADDDSAKGTAGDSAGSDKGEGADKSDADKDKVDDEGEFTADDGVEVDEDKPAGDDKPKDAAGIQLSPGEQQYIRDNIGEPLVIRGMQGDKQVELKVYTPGEIPADFKFSSDAEMISAQNGFIALERRAETLLGTYRSDLSAKEAQNFERRENEGIRQDVAELQKEGDFPKFKIQPGQEGFDNDPAAKQMQEVLNFMSERNEQYLKEFNQGRAYRHIGFREAFELWNAKNPAKAKQVEQEKEDKERHQVADKVGANRGLTASKLQKPTIRSGTTVEDILRNHEQD